MKTKHTKVFRVQHTDLETWGVEEHSEKVAPHVWKLKAGAKIRIKRPDGVFDICTLLSPCDAKAQGLWYCASCDKVLYNNWEKSSHLDEDESGRVKNPDHYLVWMCALHGPEQP